MDILAPKWDNGDVKTPYNLTTNNAFAQRHEAKKGPEKQLNDLIPIPDKTNFLPLLKQSLAENRPFAYKPSATGRTFYVPQDTVKTLIKVLEGLDDGYRDDFLDLIPLHMTELTMKCWEIKSQPRKYLYMLRYRKPTEEQHYQHIFEFDKSDLNE